MVPIFEKWRDANKGNPSHRYYHIKYKDGKMYDKDGICVAIMGDFERSLFENKIEGNCYIIEYNSEHGFIKIIACTNDN